MEKDFAPYPESLELKQLGFDEAISTYYGFPDIELLYVMDGHSKVSVRRNSQFGHAVSAPTYTQAFRFFRDKFKFDCSFEDEIVENDEGEEVEMWNFFIYKTKQKVDDKVMEFCSNNFHSYIECFSREEAELACLRKLIQIVKEHSK